MVDRLTRGTTAYYARLFGVFLSNSLTNDFLTLLYSRTNPAYSADGPLLLHTLCTHIDRNHIAFVESIKTAIRSSMLQSLESCWCSRNFGTRLITNAVFMQLFR